MRARIPLLSSILSSIHSFKQCCNCVRTGWTQAGQRRQRDVARDVMRPSLDLPTLLAPPPSLLFVSVPAGWPAARAAGSFMADRKRPVARLERRGRESIAPGEGAKQLQAGRHDSLSTTLVDLLDRYVQNNLYGLFLNF